MTHTAEAMALGELPRHAWTVVAHPVADADTAVRYIVVGPRGVFVIGDGPAPLDRLIEAAQAVSALVAPALGPAHVQAVHCAPEQPRGRSPEGVILCSPETLVETLMGRRGVITSQQVVQALLQLDGDLVAKLGDEPTPEPAPDAGDPVDPVVGSRSHARKPRHRLFRELLGLLALSAVVAVLTVFAVLQR